MKLQRRALVCDVPRCLLRAAAARNCSSHLMSPAGSPETPERFPATFLVTKFFRRKRQRDCQPVTPFAFLEKAICYFELFLLVEAFTCPRGGPAVRNVRWGFWAFATCPCSKRGFSFSLDVQLAGG